MVCFGQLEVQNDGLQGTLQGTLESSFLVFPSPFPGDENVHLETRIPLSDVVCKQLEPSHKLPESVINLYHRIMQHWA